MLGQTGSKVGIYLLTHLCSFKVTLGIQIAADAYMNNISYHSTLIFLIDFDKISVMYMYLVLGFKALGSCFQKHDIVVWLT